MADSGRRHSRARPTRSCSPITLRWKNSEERTSTRNSVRVLFADWAQEWLQTKINLRASSWTRDESYLRNHVMPEFGTVTLARIDKLQVQSWIRDLVAKGLHPSTIRECYRILRSILNEAADARLIVESPCRGVNLPRVPQVEQRFLTASQVEQLAAATDPQFRVLVYSGELQGDSFEEVSYEGYGPGGVAVLVSCLTDNRNRTAQDVRSAFNSAGGKLSEPGAVAWMFESKGVAIVTGAAEDDIFLVAADAGAEEVRASEETIEVVTPPGGP
jgi:hypothetical protein